MNQELGNKEELQAEFKTLLEKIDPYFNKLKSVGIYAILFIKE